MYTDIRRICEHPTDEDREWFPNLAGTPWLPALHHAMRNFKDESFIGQYLSPKVIRDLRLFAILDDEHQEHLRVSAIHDTAGYREVREALSRQYDLASREPDIQVWSVNLRGDRSLTLRHTRHNNRPLHDGAQEVLKHVARLWGFGVNLESVDQWGDVSIATGRSPRRKSATPDQRCATAGSAPPSRRRGSSGREGPPGSRGDFALEREDLPRVHDVLRVEGALDRSHHVDRAGAGLALQELHLVQADAVLAAAGAVHRQRAHDDASLRRSAVSRSSGLFGSTR